MKKKVVALVLSAMILSATVLGTMAYLTDSEAVTNTFTVGKIGLELDEADVKEDGTLDTNKRVTGNKYHLLPGHTYRKDPTVTVDAGSEDAYVRMLVKVENMENLQNALPKEKHPKYYAGNVFLLQMLCLDKDGNPTWNNADWEFERYDSSTSTYEFRYKEIVEKSNTETKLSALFTEITVPGEIDNEHLAYLKDVKIVVTAHAMQADGFNNADKAWSAWK